MPTIKISPDFLPNLYELQAWQTNKLVCGIDEVGRGCLAGPVTTAAVALKPHATHELLQDSKLLTAKERQIAYQWLLNNSSIGISFVHHRNIDRINIYQATLQAMKRALMQLLAQEYTHAHTQYAVVLVDAMPLKLDTPLEVVHFTNGERQSSSIAAASIVAKVTRDNLMVRSGQIFTGYGFTAHKGYATKIHKEALLAKGKTIVHRNSFLSFLKQTSL